MERQFFNFLGVLPLRPSHSCLRGQPNGVQSSIHENGDYLMKVHERTAFPHPFSAGGRVKLETVV